MLDAKVAELLNTQINKEFYSAYLYLDFAKFAGQAARCYSAITSRWRILRTVRAVQAAV